MMSTLFPGKLMNVNICPKVTFNSFGGQIFYLIVFKRDYFSLFSKVFYYRKIYEKLYKNDKISHLYCT